MQDFFTTLAPDRRGLTALRGSLAGWLERVGVAESRRADAILAAHEAVVNAIDHSGTRHPIVVRARREEQTITIEVADRGRWKPPPLDPGGRGLGLTLIAGLVDDLGIERNHDGTRVRLIHAVNSS